MILHPSIHAYYISPFSSFHCSFDFAIPQVYGPEPQTMGLSIGTFDVVSSGHADCGRKYFKGVKRRIRVSRTCHASPSVSDILPSTPLGLMEKTDELYTRCPSLSLSSIYTPRHSQATKKRLARRSWTCALAREAVELNRSECYSRVFLKPISTVALVLSDHRRCPCLPSPTIPTLHSLEHH